jgi:hypothetical protein
MQGTNCLKIKFDTKQCILGMEKETRSPPASFNFQLPETVYKDEVIRYLSCTGKRLSWRLNQ